MSETHGDLDLQSTWVVLTPSQQAVTVPVTDTVYQELDERFDGFAGHSLVALHRFDRDWPTWEQHPNGDEIVCLLSGSAELRLREAGGERRVTLDSPGRYVVVPRGTWHTARIGEPTTMLFVTPGEGTENRETPAA